MEFMNVINYCILDELVFGFKTFFKNFRNVFENMSVLAGGQRTPAKNILKKLEDEKNRK